MSVKESIYAPLEAAVRALARKPVVTLRLHGNEPAAPINFLL
jgi:hypothetical protein